MELSTLSYSGKTDASILTVTTRTDRWASGVTGVTRRGNHTTMNMGGPCRCQSGGQPVDIRRRSFYRVGKGVELPIVPLGFQDSITLGEGRGNAFIMFPKRQRKEIAGMLETPE